MNPRSCPAQVKDVPRDVTPDVTPDEAAYPPYPPVTGQPGYGNIDCNQYNDWQCFKDFFDRYKYCHPYDTRCYQDCNDYDDYRGRCSERGYGQCYDKCYYDHDGCDKWKHCREDDPECYRKKRPDGDYGHDHCQPWDWECHKKEHHHDYPDYDDHHDDHHDDDYDDYDDGEYDGHPEPKHHIAVKYFGPYGSWEQRVWPDGDEAWTGMSIPPDPTHLPSLTPSFLLTHHVHTQTMTTFL